MNRLHANIRCRNVEAYNRVLECVTNEKDVDNEGLSIFIGNAYRLDQDKWEKLDDADYVIKAQDDVLNPGFITVGNRRFNQKYYESSDIEEAIDKSVWIDDREYSCEEVEKIIEDYTKDWEI